MIKARKRTGAHKRQQRQRLGEPAMPDERKVKTAQDATAFWIACARAQLASGYTVRVGPEDDLAAFPHVDAAAHKYGRDLAGRMLIPVLVAGIQPVAKQLEEVVSLAHEGDEVDAEASPMEIVVARAAKFAGARRRAIARVARGEKNQALRHAFGISRTMKITNLEEVRRAVLALLAGRGAHPGSLAAALITDADVKTARALLAQLAELKSRQGARRASSLEANRTRDVLHAALELYYDRFAAAVDVAFEDDDELRVSLLSLIPRRKDRRAVAAKPPAPAELPHAATD